MYDIVRIVRYRFGKFKDSFIKCKQHLNKHKEYIYNNFKKLINAPIRSDVLDNILFESTIFR